MIAGDAVGTIQPMHRGLTVSVVSAILTACAAPTTGAAPPPYRLESGGRPTDLRVVVDRLYPTEEMTAIIADLQHKHARQDDGYFVRINCSTGGTQSVDNRLANGKFAVGAIGALRTGTKEGAHELEMVPGAQCPPPALPAAAPGTLTASQVVAKFESAGLPVSNPRDNTYGMCPKLDCSQLITTDGVSVYQFPNATAAQHWQPPVTFYQSGPIVLLFYDGGSHPADPTLIPRYQRMLDAMAER